jgi:hypothetical protein
MRWLLRLLLCLLALGCFCPAEPASTRPVVNIYIVRTGEHLQSPHVVSYRMLEWSQMRGRLILPDFGYYDDGYGRDQLWFVGAGADIIKRKRFLWEQELYASQEAGPDAHNQRSLWGWTVLNFNLGHHLLGESVSYPTLPLNRAQSWDFTIDRSKLEREVGAHWLAGIGYSGGTYMNNGWLNAPFATVTRKSGAGNFEFWAQRIDGGAQVQFRYQLVTGKRN